MTATTDFIAELIRAANFPDKLTEHDRRRLTDRAARTIREMRLQTGVRPGRGKDALYYLEVDALRAEVGSPEDIKKVLLEMADMIRTLKIVLDAKDEVLRGE